MIVIVLGYGVLNVVGVAAYVINAGTTELEARGIVSMFPTHDRSRV